MPDAKKPEAGLRRYCEHQGACLMVLPGKDRALTYSVVPPLDEEPTHPPVLVVAESDPGSGAFSQGVSGVEGHTENSAGGGTEEDWKAEKLVESMGPPGR